MLIHNIVSSIESTDNIVDGLSDRRTEKCPSCSANASPLELSRYDGVCSDCYAKRLNMASGQSPTPPMPVVLEYSPPVTESHSLVDDELKIHRELTSATGIDSSLLPGDLVQLLAEVADDVMPLDVPFSALLTAFASLLSKQTRVHLRGNEYYKPILWTAIVGESGTGKSNVLRQVVTSPLSKLQSDECERYQDNMALYESELEDYDKNKKVSTQAVKPNKPKLKDIFFIDVTSEKLDECSANATHGSVLVRDELKGLFDSFGRYAKTSGGGGEEQTWLSRYDGEAVKVDRRTAESSFSQSTAISVIGTIQPCELSDYLKKTENGSNGFMPRFMTVRVPTVHRQYNDAFFNTPPSHVEARLELLYRHQSTVTVDTDYSFEPSARPLIKDWLQRYEDNKHAHDIQGVKELLEKAKSRVFRVALVLHLLLSAWYGTSPSRQISIRTFTLASQFVDFTVKEVMTLYTTEGIGVESETKTLTLFIERFDVGVWYSPTDISRRLRRTGVSNSKKARELMVQSTSHGLAESNGEKSDSPKYKVRLLPLNRRTVERTSERHTTVTSQPLSKPLTEPLNVERNIKPSTPPTSPTSPTPLSPPVSTPRLTTPPSSQVTTPPIVVTDIGARLVNVGNSVNWLETDKFTDSTDSGTLTVKELLPGNRLLVVNESGLERTLSGDEVILVDFSTVVECETDEPVTPPVTTPPSSPTPPSNVEQTVKPVTPPSPPSKNGRKKKSPTPPSNVKPLTVVTDEGASIQVGDIVSIFNGYTTQHRVVTGLLPDNKFEVESRTKRDRRGKPKKIVLSGSNKYMRQHLTGNSEVHIEEVHHVNDDNRASVLAELNALPSNGITYVNLSQLDAPTSPKAKYEGIIVENILAEFEKLQKDRRLEEQRQVE